MPFLLPSLSDWRTQLRNFLAARLGTDPARPRSNANAIADMTAGGLYQQGRYVTNVAAQLFVETCDGVYLDRYGARLGMQRTAASAAAGNFVFTGTNGVPIPSGNHVLAADGVTDFTTTATETVASGSVTVPVIATVPGASGNLAPGASVNLVVGISGITQGGHVDGSGLAGGADIEGDDSFRARILFRQANPPMGGAASDYYTWAREQPGVTRAWVFPLKRGAGTVDVTMAYDLRVSFIPLSGDITAMAAFLATVAPVTADAGAFIPTADTKAVTITGLVPDNANTRAAVTAALQDLFARQATPGGAALGDGVDANNPAGSLFLGQIEAAIQGATGVANFDLTVPSADITSATGHIPVLGTITFV